MASETESVIALIVLGVIILVLSAILCTLCCLRHRQNPHRAEVMLNPDGDDTLAIGYRQEQERSRKYSMDPPKISRKSDFDDVHLDPSYTVSYVTDVEGNWEYFRHSSRGRRACTGERASRASCSSGSSCGRAGASSLVATPSTRATRSAVASASATVCSASNGGIPTG